MQLHASFDQKISGWIRPSEGHHLKQSYYVVPISNSAKLFDQYEVTYVHQDNPHKLLYTKAFRDGNLLGVELPSRQIWFQAHGKSFPYLGSLKHPDLELLLIEVDPGLPGRQLLDEILDQEGYVIIGHQIAQE
jgi:hypothetical protein